MKNLSLVLNTVMGIAIIILFYLQFSSKTLAPDEQQKEEIPTTEAIEEMIVVLRYFTFLFYYSKYIYLFEKRKIVPRCLQRVYRQREL